MRLYFVGTHRESTSVEEVLNRSLGFVIELKYTENELLFVPIIIT